LKYNIAVNHRVIGTRIALPWSRPSIRRRCCARRRPIQLVACDFDDGFKTKVRSTDSADKCDCDSLYTRGAECSMWILLTYLLG